MERKVELIPLVGVVLDGRTIRLRATRADVENLLGEPCFVHKNSLYYVQSELHIVLDDTGRVEFIELLGGPDGELQAVLDGVEVFQAQPEAVVELLKKKNGPDINDTERGYSFAFKTLSVGLYRESIPENVDEMIQEAQADGHPLDAEEIACEARRTHWAAIGVGVKDYYR